MGFLGVLRVKMWKYCPLTPKRHYPAWIRVCWCIACQNRFNGLSSRSVERFLRTQKEKKWVVTLAIWGELTPGVTLIKCGVSGDMVDVITCAILGDCRLRDVGVVKGVNLPSPIDLTRCPYNTVTLPCDRVIIYVLWKVVLHAVLSVDSLCRLYEWHLVTTDWQQWWLWLRLCSVWLLKRFLHWFYVKRIQRNGKHSSESHVSQVSIFISPCF